MISCSHATLIFWSFLGCTSTPPHLSNLDHHVQSHSYLLFAFLRGLMWTLECDGDVFDRKKVPHNSHRSESLTILPDKRLWLKPGDPLILGRTHPGKDGSSKLRDTFTSLTGTDLSIEFFVIDHKSVSRKHLIIKVKDITPGSGVSTKRISML